MRNNDKVNPAEFFKNVRSEITDLTKDIVAGEYTKEEVLSAKDEMKEILLMGYELKMSAKLDLLAEETPHLSPKEVLKILLDLLPEDIDQTFLPKVTNLVVEKWKQQPRKLAA